jgi:hypothetical protein
VSRHEAETLLTRVSCGLFGIKFCHVNALFTEGDCQSSVPFSLIYCKENVIHVVCGFSFRLASGMPVENSTGKFYISHL